MTSASVSSDRVTQAIIVVIAAVLSFQLWQLTEEVRSLRVVMDRPPSSNPLSTAPSETKSPSSPGHLADLMSVSTSLEAHKLLHEIISSKAALDTWHLQTLAALTPYIPVQTFENVDVLSLEHKGFSVESSKAFSPVLARFAHLTSLDLKRNNINDQCMQHLAPALLNIHHLDTLDLEGNRIGHVGARALGEVLMQVSSIKELHLELNRLGDKGLVELAPLLPTSLSTLNLDGNDIGDEGAKALAKELPRLTRLVSLDVRHNSIGDEGVQAIIPKVKEMKALQELAFRGNNLSDEAVWSLREIGVPGLEVVL